MKTRNKLTKEDLHKNSGIQQSHRSNSISAKVRLEFFNLLLLRFFLLWKRLVSKVTMLCQILGWFCLSHFFFDFYCFQYSMLDYWCVYRIVYHNDGISVLQPHGNNLAQNKTIRYVRWILFHMTSAFGSSFIALLHVTFVAFGTQRREYKVFY